MKQASDIISHIRSLPQFRLLKRHYCYNRFISSVNSRFKKAIAFVYVKDDTLFIALSHPGFKMEMNYQKKVFLSILDILSKEVEQCQHIKAKKVVLFNSKHNSIIKDKKIESTVPHYKEMAIGEFTIESEDEELKKAFEAVRDSIEKLQ